MISKEYAPGDPVFEADDIIADLLPLLREDARLALEGRRRTEERHRRKSPPRRPGDERHEEALEGAEIVLPPGELPWAAPSGREREPALRIAKSVPAPVRGMLPARRGALSLEEGALMDALGAKRAHIDELSRDLGLDVARLSGLLAVLEVKGMVRHYPGMYYGCEEV